MAVEEREPTRARYVGAPHRKHDGDAFLTGRVTYTNDVLLPGTLQVAILRSPHAHARILSVDTSKALADPTVVDVVTGEQAALLADPIPHNLDPASLGGNHADIRCLAHEKVVYAGQPVVAIVAHSVADAVNAIRAVDVSYDVLPAVLDVDAALAEGAPWLNDEWDSNVMISGATGEGDFDTAAAAADHVLADEIFLQRSTSAPMEPRAYIADWDARALLLTLYGTTQNPHPQRWVLATSLRIPERQIRVIAPAAGGAFGLKMHGHPEEVLVGLLARKLGRPVKWAETRAECMLSAGKEQVRRFRVAFDEDGRVRALDSVMVADHGAAAAGPGWGMAFVGSLGFPVSVSPEVSPTVGEYARMSTTAANAALKPVASHYVAGLEERLRELGADRAQVMLMTGAGGVLPAAHLKELPVAALFSGPSFDVGLIVVGGRPLMTSEVTLAGADIRYPTIDVRSIGAGGGSIASVTSGELRVGPQSAGADSLACGSGAYVARDGIDAGGPYHGPRPSIADVERNEEVTPMRVLYRRLAPDTGGSGRLRGGASAEVAFTIGGVDQVQALIMTHGLEVPNATGLLGGAPGSQVRQRIGRGARAGGRFRSVGPLQDASTCGGEWHALGFKPGLMPLHSDDVIALRWQGGGGIGDPLEREPASVAADVFNALVTRESARSIYGVVVGENGWDEDATALARAAIREQRIGREAMEPVAISPDALTAPFGDGVDLVFEDRETTVRSRGHVLVEGTTRWRAAAVQRPFSMPAGNPALHPDLAMTAHYCPHTAALLAVDVHPKNAAPIDDCILDLASVERLSGIRSVQA